MAILGIPAAVTEALGVIGTVVSTVGSVFGGSSQQSQAQAQAKIQANQLRYQQDLQAQQLEAQAQEQRYQAQVANNNSILAQQNQSIAEQNAERAKRAAAIKAQNESMQSSAKTAAAKAAAAASGLDPNSGSPLDVTESNRTLGLLNAQTTINNGLLDAYGYQVTAHDYAAQSQNFLSQAGLNNLTGANQLAGATEARRYGATIQPAPSGGGSTGSLLSAAGTLFGGAKNFNWGSSSTSNDNENNQYERQALW